VALHVFPLALFAVIHGSVAYRGRGIAVFTCLCLGVGSAFESLSLRTGFPFGHYSFTNVMGPKLLQLPVMLALAYVGMGYISWIVGLLILGYASKPISGSRTFSLPILASFIMVAWDLAMEPVWATIDRAWIWRDGGAYFGVPVSNFFGWYLTVFVFYQLFALFLRGQPERPRSENRVWYWRLPILCYAASAGGNLLLAIPGTSFAVTDAAGRQWMASDVIGVCALVSLFVMMPFAFLAWVRLNDAAETLLQDLSRV
jgi:uncharacterized membrane protein